MAVAALSARALGFTANPPPPAGRGPPRKGAHRPLAFLGQAPIRREGPRMRRVAGASSLCILCRMLRFAQNTH